MKSIKYILASLIALPLLTACVDDDYQNIVKQGDPVIHATEVAEATMGESFDMVVNCSDAKGTALSTLKAELCYSDEVVDQTVIRTKEAGDYTVSLVAPFLQYVPNGTAKVRLTLQNVTTSTTIVEVYVDVNRPHFNNLQFITADGETYNMTEGDDYNYSTTVPVSQNAFKGTFATADGKYVFGNGGATAALGETGQISFQCATPGDVTVTFNTRDYTYGPQEELDVTPLDFQNTDGGNIFEGTLVQGALYKFTGNSAVQGSDWYYDPDFFTDNGDGTFTFNALTGTYTMKAVFESNGFRIHVGTQSEPATLQADGTGAIWIIGDAVYGKPDYSQAQSWWTDTDHALCLAPVGEKLYQVTLTVGKQLKPGDSTNFKFFGQAGWGTEFKGTDGDYLLTCNSDVFAIGDGNGHDNGNIYLQDGAVLNEGDTYVFTIDLTAGVGNGVLTVKRGVAAGVQVIDLTTDVLTRGMKQGTTYSLQGIVDSNYYVDSDFFRSNGDGTYTFLAISGTYNLAAYADYQYVQVYPAKADGSAATMQADGTGAIWIIGSECVNKPYLTSENNKGWWTDPVWDQCMAPIADKKYRITLTVGEQLSASDINFKFFGQPTWGVEFNGLGGDYHLDTDNEWFRINAADSDNGNIFLRDGATLNAGETYVFTIDLSNGTDKGVLTVERK